MSYKAYVVRIRTEQDVDDLDKYLNNSNMEDVAWLDFFYKPSRSFSSFKVNDTDLVAAITVDRANLRESYADEGVENPPYFCRLDDLPHSALERVGEDLETRVNGWEALDPPEKGWTSWAKSRL